MQDRYAGDIGDFGKLGLLRELSRKYTVGINWYNPGELDFERDEKGRFRQEDGRYRDLSGVRECDTELTKALAALKKERSIKKLEELGLIENAVYFGHIVPKGSGERDRWHKAALEKLGGCDIIFLDPDNGLLCDSVRKGSPKSVKYAYYNEVSDYLEKGKAVIIYNHRSRKQEAEYFGEITGKLCSKAGAERDSILIVSFRKFSVRDYFIVCRDDDTYSNIRGIVEAMVNGKWGEGAKPFCTMQEHTADIRISIDHIAMYVSDLEAARDFFTGYLGGISNDGYHNKKTGFRSYFISFDGGARLELMNRADVAEADRTSERTGYSHIAFSVGSREKVDELTERLRSAGYEVKSGPRTTGDGYYESCIVAVEGNLIEITV